MILINRREEARCYECGTYIYPNDLAIFNSTHEWTGPQKIEVFCPTCYLEDHKNYSRCAIAAPSNETWTLYLCEARKALEARLSSDQEKQLRLPGI